MLMMQGFVGAWERLLGKVQGRWAALFSLIGLLYLAKVAVVDPFVDGTDSQLTQENANTIGFFWLSVILIAAGSLLGAVGSGITLRRFLKV